MSGRNFGWVKLHRQFLGSAIWRDFSLMRLWVWCLLKAKKTWKRGRKPKPKPKAEKQSERVVVYLTPNEARQIRADSDGAGSTPSAFLTGLWREWRED